MELANRTLAQKGNTAEASLAWSKAKEAHDMSLKELNAALAERKFQEQKEQFGTQQKLNRDRLMQEGYTESLTELDADGLKKLEKKSKGASLPAGTDPNDPLGLRH